MVLTLGPMDSKYDRLFYAKMLIIVISQNQSIHLELCDISGFEHWLSYGNADIIVIQQPTDNCIKKNHNAVHVD